MNRIQMQISEVFDFAKKYEMSDKDTQLHRNAIQMLINALGIVADKGLEQEVINKGKT